MGTMSRLSNNKNVSRSVRSSDGSGSEFDLAKELGKIKGMKNKLHLFVNSESYKINGSIKKSVLDLFEELQDVVTGVVRENGRLQQRVETLQDDNLRL